MKKKYQNIFFIFGIAVLVVMVTQLDFQQVWQGLCHAGYWFVAVLVLWIFLYIFNTSAIDYDEPLANPLPKLYHEKRDDSEKVRFAIPKKHENAIKERQQ